MSYDTEHVDNFEEDDIDDVIKCPYCGLDGIVRYAGGEHVCHNCNGEGFIDVPNKEIK